MLEIAVVALIVSVISGALGFRGLSRGAATVAKIFFVIFLVVALLFILLFALGISIIF